MMRRLVLWSIGLFLSFNAQAQQGGKVQVNKDPLIDSLIIKRLELLKEVSSPNAETSKPLVSAYGYRVQIFYDSDRRAVFAQQARFKSLYQKVNTYISYKAPNYYLRVGDFRNRLEAQQFLNSLRPDFPTLFIQRERINTPNLD